MHKDVISVLIVEDESIWSSTLELYLTEAGYAIAGIADTFEKAVIALNKRDYDIVLLDISLDSRKSGIELGKLINTLYKKPFIFITASFGSHTLQEAIDAAPAGYLSKPVSENSLFITMQNALRFYNQATAETAAPQPEPQPDATSFYIKQGNSYVKVEWCEVVSLSVEQNYTRVLTLQNKNGYLIRSTLQKTLESIVPEPLRGEFIRINRAEVVKRDYIEELRGQTVITPLKSFSITESFLKEVKQKLHLIS